VNIFVPGRLRNPLNSSWGFWAKHARASKDWRTRTAQSVLVSELMRRHRGTFDPTAPKHVTFTAHTWNRWDSDEGVNAACKPLRDGLVDARVIHSDASDSGHSFSYTQVVDRARRGVEILIEPLEARP
jgi:hypothetical protein